MFLDYFCKLVLLYYSAAEKNEKSVADESVQVNRKK